MKHEGIAKDSPRITSHKQRVIDLQEQIPPAKFDWTSSGLTNPLEGPGKLSCLFFFYDYCYYSSHAQEGLVYLCFYNNPQNSHTLKVVGDFFFGCFK